MTTNPSGALATISRTFECCVVVLVAVRPAFKSVNRIRKNDACSSRNSDADVTNSRAPSTERTVTSLVRPVARTAPINPCRACELSSSKPSGKRRPTRRLLPPPNIFPAAGLASMIFRVAASDDEHRFGGDLE